MSSMVNPPQAMRSTTFYLFLDGIGCGTSDEQNPALATPAQLFATFADCSRQVAAPFGGRALCLDACLGVAGKPQSGTGHTALLTGVNAPAHLGMHLWALPNRALRALLETHGIFGRLNKLGMTTRFLNSYRPPFFDWGDQVWSQPRWRRFLSATSWANHYAGNPFYDFEDLRARRAVAHDYTNAVFREAGFDVPVWTASEAGALVAARAGTADFLAHEHFLTDLVGHRGTYGDAVAALTHVEQFVLSLLDALDLTRHRVIIASDHGNIEEPQHGSHTTNPAFGMAWGPPVAGGDPTDLTEVAPWIERSLNGRQVAEAS